MSFKKYELVLSSCKKAALCYLQMVYVYVKKYFNVLLCITKQKASECKQGTRDKCKYRHEHLFYSVFEHGKQNLHDK